ncbi:hypothetical protein [Caudoviricetes sp.]|nr:hypothetical protein [Caudoviricetes sp.]UOF82757.1 hypothetical protein [Caudoviricetes sp.]
MPDVINNQTRYAFNFNRRIITFDDLNTEEHRAWLMPTTASMHKVQFDLLIALSTEHHVDYERFVGMVEEVIVRSQLFETTGVYHLAFTEDGICELAATEISGPMEPDAELTAYGRNDWSVGGSSYYTLGSLEQLALEAVGTIKYSLNRLVEESS